MGIPWQPEHLSEMQPWTCPGSKPSECVWVPELWRWLIPALCALACCKARFCSCWSLYVPSPSLGFPSSGSAPAGSSSPTLPSVSPGHALACSACWCHCVLLTLGPRCHAPTWAPAERAGVPGAERLVTELLITGGRYPEGCRTGCYPSRGI